MCDDDDDIGIENRAYIVHAITITSGYICRHLRADTFSYIVIIVY